MRIIESNEKRVEIEFGGVGTPAPFFAAMFGLALLSWVPDFLGGLGLLSAGWFEDHGMWGFVAPARTTSNFAMSAALSMTGLALLAVPSAYLLFGSYRRLSFDLAAMKVHSSLRGVLRLPERVFMLDEIEVDLVPKRTEANTEFFGLSVSVLAESSVGRAKELWATLGGGVFAGADIWLTPVQAQKLLFLERLTKDGHDQHRVSQA